MSEVLMKKICQMDDMTMHAKMRLRDEYIPDSLIMVTAPKMQKFEDNQHI